MAEITTNIDVMNEVTAAVDKVDAAMAEIYRIMDRFKKNLPQYFARVTEAAQRVTGPPSEALLNEIRVTQWEALEHALAQYKDAFALISEQVAIVNKGNSEVSALNNELIKQHQQEIEKVLGLDAQEASKRVRLMPIAGICQSFENRCSEHMQKIAKLAPVMLLHEKEILGKKEELLNRWRNLI